MKSQIPTTNQFIDEITAFRDRHGMSSTMFGRLSGKDPGFLIRLGVQGKTLTMKRARTISLFMARFDKAQKELKTLND